MAQRLLLVALVAVLAIFLAARQIAALPSDPIETEPAESWGRFMQYGGASTATAVAPAKARSSSADRLPSAPPGLPPPAAGPGMEPGATPSRAGPQGFEQRRVEARRFLATLHRDFLGREGDAEALRLWADLIAAGTQTREQAVEHFLDSAANLEGAAPLARLYLATFQRAPDEAGWSHWRSLVASGHSLETISDAFAASDEFASAYGGMNESQFVDLAYRNTLGRAPTPAELAQWQSGLFSGITTRGRVLLALSESSEFRDAVTNEVNASLLYSGLLGRTPDAPGFAAWMRTLEREPLTRSALIARFLDSPEYRARTITAATPGH